MSLAYTSVFCSVSDESGSLETSLVAEGEISRDMLDSSDVFIVDDGKKVIVWIGSGASPDENKNALTYAHVSLHSLAALHAFTHAPVITSELLDGH